MYLNDRNMLTSNGSGHRGTGGFAYEPFLER